MLLGKAASNNEESSQRFILNDIRVNYTHLFFENVRAIIDCNNYSVIGRGNL